MKRFAILAIATLSLGMVACDESLTHDNSLSDTYPDLESCLANAVTASQQTQCANAF